MDLRYPIGKFEAPRSITPSLRAKWIDEIDAAPALLRDAVQGLDDSQLDTPYRPAGWTIRQVIHHVPDSHMNSYIRFRLALTEQTPTIKPYDEVKWAELYDARTGPVEVSLQLLKSLHLRWVALLRSFSETDFAREYDHPENGVVRLDSAVAAYAWHGKHHAAHITAVRERMGWK
jgi:DinB family protein